MRGPSSVPQLVKANGVELCVDTYGERTDPAILLIMGTSASMDWWETEFCERLAGAGRFVIRYDHRDTGQSTTYEPGAPGYGGDELDDDAVGVLDALEISRAHLVGISMGAAIAQLVALEHPDRVASLTLISTTFAVPSGLGLPGMRADAARAFARLEHPDWSDREAVIEYGVESTRPLSGSGGFDEDANRELWARVVDRTRNIESSFVNHDLIHDSESRPRGPITELEAPTLVIHGTDDPLFPVEHGEALAREIPHARLLRLEGVGHELPRRAWDVVVPAIAERTAAR
jgi:pimeloyl-ACP methyl ester carboxylesterase